ncbi:winged helix DNA-binding protein [Sphingomonas sp. URHD0057]|uniref:winged helix DNA-binding protein n=1 Tax=Sphingomonas sp. URHD0057 TaxID=1380389 RepID=UPI000AE965CC|nr:winged helix DNA-binding protein [Sphingomonas sp. URHD0057]
MNYAAVQRPEKTEQEIARLQEELRALKSKLEAERGAMWVRSAHARPNVQRIIEARRAREEIISRELFADPAWDILLALYRAELRQHSVSTSALCIASAVPATTALRWIDKLEHLGFLTREGDPLDGRRFWVALSPTASAKMESYFNAISVSGGAI